MWHETQWTVVSDPPNGMTTLSRFDTQEECVEYMSNLVKHGNSRNEYVLPPSNPKYK